MTVRISSVVAHLPATTEKLDMGFWLHGSGNITFLNFKIEVIDPSTPELTPTPWGVPSNQLNGCPTRE